MACCFNNKTKKKQKQNLGNPKQNTASQEAHLTRACICVCGGFPKHVSLKVLIGRFSGIAVVDVAAAVTLNQL